MSKITDLPGASTPVTTIPEPPSIDPAILAAIRVITAAWEHGTTYDLASQAAFALHDMGLLAPTIPDTIREQTRTGNVEAEPSPQAVFWHKQCERARQIARELENEVVGGTGVAVVADYDRVTVAVDPAMDGAPDDIWQFVQLQLGVTSTRVQGWFLVGDGEYKGERIRLVGHSMVEALPAVSA